MNEFHDFAAYRSIVIGILVLWSVLSAALLLTPRRLLKMATRNDRFPVLGIWIARLLGFLNLVGSMHILLQVRG